MLSAVPQATAQQEVDLIDGFADMVGFTWTTKPPSAAHVDATNDLFLLEGGAATGGAQLDLLRTEQFGFTVDEQTYGALFSEDGALDCDSDDVSCPEYDIQPEPFLDGVFVIGLQLAGPLEASPATEYTAAVLAFDDDWPTFTDPRPFSPFVGINKAWRLDVAGDGATTVRYVQVVTGPFEEFQTDTRVIHDGNLIWFVIPAGEFPLDTTIRGFRGHTYQEPVADVDGDGGAPAMTTPVGPSGVLEEAGTPPPVTSTPGGSTTVGETPTTGAETTTPEPETPASSIPEVSTGVSPLVWVVAAAALILVLFVLFRPRRKCEKEYEAWQTAQAACDSAHRAAEEAEAEAERLRAELDRLRAEYPPLGFDQSDEPTIEMDDGEWMSALDVALTQWDNRTRQPPVSLGDGGPRSEVAAEAAAQRHRLREEYERMRRRETELMVAVSEAERLAREARTKAEDLCAKAEEAHRAYLDCIGAGTGAGAAPEDDAGEQPPAPEPPPEEGTGPPEELSPDEEPPPTPPEEPTPAPPAPPPPAPPPPAPTREETPPPRECEEGATRETDVRQEVFEMLRDRSRATITIANDVSSDVEEILDLTMGAITEATRWAAAQSRIRGRENVLYTVDISMQMERVTARCYVPEICQNGRWVRMTYTQREVSEPEYFEMTIHHENLDHKTLRHVLLTARNKANAAGREQLDRFCR